MGPSRDNLSPGLRVHCYRDYDIYSRHTDREVVIVRVRHGSRDAQALLVEDDG